VRTIFIILILIVVALIGAVATGFLDISQTRQAEAPQISANAQGVTATGGQAPAFDVQTGTVSVGTQPENVTVQVPKVSVNEPVPPANTQAPTNSQQ